MLAESGLATKFRYLPIGCTGWVTNKNSSNLQQNAHLKRWASSSLAKIDLPPNSRALFSSPFAGDWGGGRDVWDVSLAISTYNCLWQQESSSAVLTLLNTFSFVPFPCKREGTSAAKAIWEAVLVEVLEHPCKNHWSFWVGKTHEDPLPVILPFFSHHHLLSYQHSLLLCLGQDLPTLVRNTVWDLAAGQLFTDWKLDGQLSLYKGSN